MTTVAQRLRLAWRRLPLRRRPFTHLDDYAANNSAVGRRDAIRGSRRIDRDLQVSRDRVGINTHWPHPKIEGFALNHIVPKRPFRRLPWATISRLRSPAGYAIDSMANALTLDAKAGMAEVEIDAKDDRRLEDTAWWIPLRAHCRTLEAEYGMTVIVKTASNLGGRRRAGRRMRAAHKAGFTTLLLTRGNRKMHRRFKQYIDDVRGLPVRWVGKR